MGYFTFLFIYQKDSDSANISYCDLKRNWLILKLTLTKQSLLTENNGKI